MFHFTPIPTLNIGFWQLSTHGLLIASGFLLALFFATRAAKRRGLDPAPLEGAASVGAIAGLIGARLVYIIFWGQGMTVAQMLSVWQGGLSSHGGYIFGVLGAIIYFKIKKVDLLAYLDAAAPYLLLGWGIGRIGCFLNWDSYGKISDSVLAVIVFGESRLPTQLFESFGYLVCFSGLMALIRKTSVKIGKGGLTAASLGLFVAVRFTVDFYRDDIFSYFIFSQILTALIFVASLYFFLRSIKKTSVV